MRQAPTAPPAAPSPRFELTVRSAMRRALDLARRGPVGLNPRVGAVLLDPDGCQVGQGWHEGAGTAHAEVMALAQAGPLARGATAVVTLEPCDHTGRTGPCSRALLAAGVARVVHARPDVDRQAAGGAARLRAAGVEVSLIDDPVLRQEADALVGDWAAARRMGRPFVTWKFAATLDGRSAAADGTSRWITSQDSRADVHRLRGEQDVVLVGTGTVLADDPLLTVRTTDGAPARHQPSRAVMGLRDLPAGARLAQEPTDGAGTVHHLRTRDPREAVDLLWREGRRAVLLEGGPVLAAAFWRAGLVDRVVAYLAPALLGAGASAVADLGIGTVADLARLRLDDVTRIGDDVRLTLTPRPAPTEPAPTERSR